MRVNRVTSPPQAMRTGGGGRKRREEMQRAGAHSRRASFAGRTTGFSLDSCARPSER